MLWGDEENERRWREAVEQQKRDEAAKEEAKWTPAYGQGGGGGSGCLLMMFSLLIKMFRLLT